RLERQQRVNHRDVYDEKARCRQSNDTPRFPAHQLPSRQTSDNTTNERPTPSRNQEPRTKNQEPRTPQQPKRPTKPETTS
ncbi:MAG: hypothetical protein ACLFVJ_22530, partial [Persicimonas sp.]